MPAGIGYGPKALGKMGRMGDTTVGHLTPGEVVVPRQVLAQGDTRDQLVKAFMGAGAPMGRYTVGGMDDSINPRTGMREYYDASTGGEQSSAGMGGDDDGGGEGYGGGYGTGGSRTASGGTDPGTPAGGTAASAAAGAGIGSEGRSFNDKINDYMNRNPLTLVPAGALLGPPMEAMWGNIADMFGVELGPAPGPNPGRGDPDSPLPPPAMEPPPTPPPGGGPEDAAAQGQNYMELIRLLLGLEEGQSLEDVLGMPGKGTLGPYSQPWYDPSGTRGFY